MIELPQGADGWARWPPQTEAIAQALQGAWASGEWGKYDSPVHARCVDTVTQAMSMSSESVAAISPLWQFYLDRMEPPPLIRLCSSGTAAVELALRCCGVVAGDEVVVAAYDYPGNFRCIELLGATPVLADVRPRGVTMDPQSLREIEGDDIKGVVVSHLYGELADILAIREICDQRNWWLIEDACQVPGAGWEVGKDPSSSTFAPVGCLADCATLSFGGSKLLSAGNGGAIVTRNPRLHSRLRSFLDRPSDMLPLSALQCAVLIPQWGMLDELNRRRCDMVSRLRGWDWTRLGAAPISMAVGGQTNAHYKFAVQAKDASGRALLLRRLRSIGLPVGEGFRSMHGTSGRRSRKPVSLDHSQLLGERCLVIDHRALLANDLIERLDQACITDGESDAVS
ncbi:DegT/DnrJ/EryC1/StrS family aminotransferase [Allorhodopirellula heiligendammensis]|uniref:L-glutamine:2-deoxy-scyllo-inosose aminotransferase n=1 Tax=Allorhodopirellula heiligendammensis TaxID=2714739 RepID=A0A5C6C294_9BACT|nr:DegT/DnrJ/EryC1/StrS family aminotransferase [Allorhodopirellula heiligendammensis]TWU18690.1 L-glutamine:2-deoxy-scyllo-inosose aminotransferase [Allorhodopirellula heiligendammensis]